MASTIITKNSSTAGAVPLAANLTQGELAINTTDRRLYTKDATGTVVEVGGINGSVNYVESFSGDDVTTTFTLTHDPLFENCVDIYINGIYQNKDTFSIASKVITFTEAPVSGTNNIEVTIWQSAPIGSTDANYVSYTPAGTGAVATTVQTKLRESVSVFDFMTSAQIADVQAGTGSVDVTAAIQAALNSGAKRVRAPAGTYLITSRIDVPNYVTLQGDGFSVFAGSAPTRFLKRGSFTGVRVNVASQLRDIAVDGDTGNGLDGIQVFGGRSFLENVESNGHGRDGFHIGGYSTDTYAATNTNLWRAVNLIARSNTRNGCTIQHEGAGAVPNNNAGTLLGLDAGYNGNDGLYVTESYDNQLLGVCCQVNTNYGVHFSTQAKGNYLPAPYLEANVAGDLILDAGADRNYIYGSRGGAGNSGYVNNGADNIVIGRYNSLNPVPLHEAPEAFQDLQILERTTSGLWQFKKEATTRNLLLQLTGTSSSSGDVVIQNTGTGSSGLKVGGGFASSTATVSIPTATATTVATFGTALTDAFCGIINVRDAGGTNIGATAIVTNFTSGGTQVLLLSAVANSTQSASSLTVSGGNIQFSHTFGTTRSFTVTLVAMGRGKVM